LSALLAWLEASPLGEAVRGAGVWAYAVINAAHIAGIASLFGAILVLDLRLLGWRRARPLHDVAAGTVPVAAAGLAVALVSGVCLLATNAREYAGNPFLLIKFAALGLGLVNLTLLHRSSAWRAMRTRLDLDARARQRLVVGGGVSLAGWLTTLLAGRMLGYW
jgi:cytochrome bd-type quinol oxidase subunit 2